MAPIKSGVQSSEFWTFIGVLLGNVVMLLVMFGIIKPQDQDSITKAIGIIVSGLGVSVGSFVGLCAYIKGTTTVKVEQMRINADTAVKMESLRAGSIAIQQR